MACVPSLIRSRGSRFKSLFTHDINSPCKAKARKFGLTWKCGCFALCEASHISASSRKVCRSSLLLGIASTFLSPTQAARLEASSCSSQASTGFVSASLSTKTKRGTPEVSETQASSIQTQAGLDKGWSASNQCFMCKYFFCSERNLQTIHLNKFLNTHWDFSEEFADRKACIATKKACDEK